MNGTLFQTHELSVEFGGLTALNNLDLRVDTGWIVGLIGPNGAGKTTAFNAITGIVKSSKGSITFRGKDITAWNTPDIARFGIARTFQNIRLYDDLRVIENVMVAGHSSIRYSFIEAVVRIGRFGSDERAVREKAESLLELMGLQDLAGEKASSLPYGMQRRLEVARALALDPKLLLLDEPVAGMNPSETRDFGDILSKLHSERNLTIALIEHDMGFVMDVCHMIKVIDHGVPIAWGTPKEIQNNDEVIAAYLGEG